MAARRAAPRRRSSRGCARSRRAPTAADRSATRRRGAASYGLKPSRSRVSPAPGPESFFSINGPIGPHRRRHRRAARRDAGLREGRRALGHPAGAPVPRRRSAPTRASCASRSIRIRASRRTTIAPANRQAVLDTATLLSEMGHELVEAAPPSFDAGVPRPGGDDLRRQLRRARGRHPRSRDVRSLEPDAARDGQGRVGGATTCGAWATCSVVP